MRVVSARDSGWQKFCWELAQAGMAFEIHDFTPEQILFVQELCAAYRYQHTVLGKKLQLHSHSPSQPMIPHDLNSEIERELKRLLRKITDSKKQPDKETLDICARYIALCLESDNLGAKAIEIAERILDMMEHFSTTPGRPTWDTH
jgi:hypothetical protein